MKRIMHVFSLVGLLLASTVGAEPVNALVPKPNAISWQAREWQVPAELSFALPGAGPTEGELVRRLTETFARLGCKASPGKPGAVRLEIDAARLPEAERYELEVAPEGIVLRGHDGRALLHAVRTLDQLALGRRGALPCVRVDDRPMFGFRALLIDPARHFIPAREVKRYIDRMARYKFNVLQLHLTDDQGWRVEIKAFPALTGKGPFYTQTELRDIVAYGVARGVDVLPEVDLPGHTTALLEVMPELACDLEEAPKATQRMVCAANPKGARVLNAILKEVCAIFPYPYIHLGGDESVIDKNWAKCGRCQALQKQKGFAAPRFLMQPFFEALLPTVRAAGKRPILWCELDNIRPPAKEFLFDYPDDALLVSWRNALTPMCAELTGKAGLPLILAPGEHAYLDYPQYQDDFPERGNWGMPTTTLRQAYAFRPIQAPNIQGVMGTLWGEAIRTPQRLSYMTYPRALAIAEAGWTKPEHRGWDDFVARMWPNLDDLMRRGVPFRVPFEIVPQETP